MHDEVRVDLPPPHYSDELNRLASIYNEGVMPISPTLCEKVPPFAPNWGDLEVWCLYVTPTVVNFSVRVTQRYELYIYARQDNQGWHQSTILSALHHLGSKDGRSFIEEEIEQAHDKIKRLPKGLRGLRYEQQDYVSTLNELMQDWPPVVQEQYVAVAVAAELEERR